MSLKGLCLAPESAGGECGAGGVVRRKLEEALEASVAGGQQRSKNSACGNGEKRGEFRLFRDLSTHATLTVNQR